VLFRVVFRPQEPPAPSDWESLIAAWPPRESYWSRMNYFRENRAAAAGAHLFLRVPAAGWPVYVDSTPPDVDLLLEVPSRREVFDDIRQWLLNTDRRNRCYLLPPPHLPPDYGQALRRLADTAWGVELLPPEDDGRHTG
jgi:hypothetical protein